MSEQEQTTIETPDGAASGFNAGLELNGERKRTMDMTLQPAKIMMALHDLALVGQSLRFLARHGVVRDDAIVKGCRKFVKDHPEIQAWIDSDSFLSDIGSNVEVTGAARHERE